MSSVIDETTDESLSRLVEERSRELQLLRAVAAVQKGACARCSRTSAHMLLMLPFALDAFPSSTCA